jgi:hypothetical protein
MREVVIVDYCRLRPLIKLHAMRMSEKEPPKTKKYKLDFFFQEFKRGTVRVTARARTAPSGQATEPGPARNIPG